MMLFAKGCNLCRMAGFGVEVSVWSITAGGLVAQGRAGVVGGCRLTSGRRTRGCVGGVRSCLPKTSSRVGSAGTGRWPDPGTN